MRGVEHKSGEPAPPPEPRLLAVAEQEVVHLFVARLRRQILQEVEEAKAAEPTAFRHAQRSTTSSASFGVMASGRRSELNCI
jgi:hypothetical protein